MQEPSEIADERAIVAAARDGDPSAFARIVAIYGRRIVSYCHRMCGSSAEDLAQEIFVKLHLAIGGFDPGRALSPFLFRIARRWLGARHPTLQTLAGLAVLQAAAILGDIVGLFAGFDSPFALALGALGMLICISGSFIGLGAIIASRFGKRTLAQTVAARQLGALSPPHGPPVRLGSSS